jgi:hypothetical protein
MGTRDLRLDETLGLNCAWYADILLTLTSDDARVPGIAPVAPILPVPAPAQFAIPTGNPPEMSPSYPPVVAPVIAPAKPAASQT